MTNIAHIINPVKVSDKNDLYIAQPITFQSILKAQKFALQAENIKLFTVQFEEDIAIIPKEFQQLSNLSRSVLDVNSNLKKRPLPLVKDIFEKFKEIENADYYLYTNMDIALMPSFYDSLFSYIRLGHDAVVINRRRLSSKYNAIEQLPLMYADLGKSHPGFDCFLMHKSLLEKFILGNICVGISFFETTLIHNLASFAQKPLFVTDAHLTFHIGMEVLVPRKNAFYNHNKKEFFNNIYPKLKPHFSLKKFPYTSLPIYKRALKWMLNPSIFSLNYLRLEGQNIFQKSKAYLDEIRWRILQK